MTARFELMQTEQVEFDPVQQRGASRFARLSDRRASAGLLP